MPKPRSKRQEEVDIEICLALELPNNEILRRTGCSYEKLVEIKQIMRKLYP